MFERLTVIGFGDFMSAPYIAASIANFYGEREVEIFTWDENKERCDAMCRVLRMFLRLNRIRHHVFTRESREAALSGSQGLVLCNNQYPDLQRVSIPIFNVKAHQWWEEDPAQPVTIDEQKFQILRWINKEEYPTPFLYQNRESPLVQWLNTL